MVIVMVLTVLIVNGNANDKLVSLIDLKMLFIDYNFTYSAVQ